MPSLLDPSQAMEFFELARAYQYSANKLLDQLPPKPRIGLPLSDPIYFLFYHSTELALKACLLSDAAPVKQRHGIRELFQNCQTRQLLDIVDGHHELYNLIVFLGGLRDDNKEDHGIGYRYASRNGLAPDLEWVRDGVRELIAKITPLLEIWTDANGIAGRVTRIQVRSSQAAPSGTIRMKSEPGPPMTLGNAASA